MANDKLLNLDGEKLQLYITKSKHLPKLLKNSGSLIVYKDEDLEHYGAQSSNYIYLGNEMIAGGWGFNNEEQKTTALEHLITLPIEIAGIQSRLSGEIYDRINGDQTTTNMFSFYVPKGSPIDSTGENNNNLYFSNENFDTSFFINNNLSNPFYAKNLLSLLKPAEYKDLEVHHISHECKVGFFVGQEFVEYENTTMKDNICYVPYNSILERYTIGITYEKNDSGGIKSAHIARHVYTQNVENHTYHVYNYLLDTTDTILDNNENSSRTYFNIKWNSSYNTNDNVYMLFDVSKDITEYDLIRDFNVIVKETPTSKYKKFPLLTDFELNSIENIIKEYTFPVETIKFKPCYIFYYNNCVNGNVVNKIIPENLRFNKTCNYKTYDNHMMIIGDKLEFYIDFGNSNSHFMSFALPSIYCIKDIYVMQNDESRNVTGLFKVIKNMGISMNPFEHNERYIKIPYNYYYMFSDLKFMTGKFKMVINIEFATSYNKNILLQTAVNENTGLYYMFTPSTYLLRNDEFDGSHWTNGYPEQFTNWLSYDIEYAEEECVRSYLEKTLLLAK